MSGFNCGAPALPPPPPLIACAMPAAGRARLGDEQSPAHAGSVCSISRRR
jgi:hypothetical protein